MKIGQLTITNVTSYGEPTTFDLHSRLNILIGPNGGGKSNFQKILAVVLSNYFIHQYNFTRDEENARIEQLSLWSARVIRQELDKFAGNEGNQEIIIQLIPEASDLRNIELIGNHLAEFNEHLAYWESPVTRYDPVRFINEIREAKEFTYRIKNMEPPNVDAETPAWAFMEYLKTFFIFMRLSSRVPGVDLTSPVFFFFSERKFNRQVRVQSNQITENNYYTGFRSAYQAAMGHETNLLQWGAQHFARLFWKAINQAGRTREATVEDIIDKEPAVQLLSKYLEKLGYGWTFETDEDSVEYVFQLVVDEKRRRHIHTE